MFSNNSDYTHEARSLYHYDRNLGRYNGSNIKSDHNKDLSTLFIDCMSSVRHEVVVIPIIYIIYRNILYLIHIVYISIVDIHNIWIIHYEGKAR